MERKKDNNSPTAKHVIPPQSFLFGHLPSPQSTLKPKLMLALAKKHKETAKLRNGNCGKIPTLKSLKASGSGSYFWYLLGWLQDQDPKIEKSDEWSPSCTRGQRFSYQFSNLPKCFYCLFSLPLPSHPCEIQESICWKHLKAEVCN